MEIGDLVRVTMPELYGMEGKVIKIKGDLVTVQWALIYYSCDKPKEVHEMTFNIKDLEVI